MKLVVTIDVEEEGLFSGRYEFHNTSVRNVAELVRLDSLLREWNITPTLLLAHPVATDKNCRDLLLRLKQQWKAEIGAHLHPWSTPPFQNPSQPEPVPSERIPRDLLQAKLESLLQSIRHMGVTPTSFRMGRFDIGSRIFSLLETAGIRVDSSVAPMWRFHEGPERLAAPADPYFPDPAEPRRPGGSCVLEVPITILPALPRLDELLDRMPIPAKWASWLAMHVGAISAQPMYTALPVLKTAARLHRDRGGQVLTIHFHSSELMPGGCPRHRTTHDVDRFLARLRAFFAWLHREMPVESLTLSQIGRLASPALRPLATEGS